MFHHFRRESFCESGSRTAEFHGKASQAGVSFFLVDTDPGRGPALHMHQYPETWILESGSASFTIGAEQMDFGSGDIVVVPPFTPHKFVNTGEAALKMVCIHASDTIVNLPPG